MEEPIGIDHMKKAFIFTLDAFFAILLAGAFIASINFFHLSQSSTDSRLLGKLSDDMLAAFDESGVLRIAMQQSSPQDELAYLLSKLPQSIAGHITVDEYDYQNGLVRLQSVFEASVRTIGAEVVSSRRVFADSSTEKYYIATLEVSYAS